MVFIHITFPDIFGQIVGKASAFAVPIFLMISGYYAFGSDCTVIKRRLFKIVKIFVFAYIVFFAYLIAGALFRSELDTVLKSYFSLQALVKAICFCTIDFAIPLWYLIAMIETYAVWFFIVKHKKEQAALNLIPFLFVFQILLISYCDTMYLEWFWKINFIARAMPWFLLGYFMHTEKAKKMQDIDSYKLVILASLGCVIVVLPVVIDLPFDFSSIGYIPYSFGLFALALKNPTQKTSKSLEFIGNKLSLNIYIFHAPVGGAIGVFAEHLGQGITSHVLWTWCRPIVVLFSTILLSWIIYIVCNAYKRMKQNKALS